MKVINKIEQSKFPFVWVDLEKFRKSDANRVEIYLMNKDVEITTSLILMFDFLFEPTMNKLFIYCDVWGDYCLDAWDINTGLSNYNLEEKSKESKIYLEFLKNQNIDYEYSGTCECFDWSVFLNITLPCIVNKQAPYSHLIFSEDSSFFLYFHESGSVGIYYKELNSVVRGILDRANEKYLINPYD
jgi:hypothetical protein